MPSTAGQGDPTQPRATGTWYYQPGSTRGRRLDRSARGPRHRKRTSFRRELAALVFTALTLTFLVQTFVARVYVIPSQSMEQTLHGCPGCNNDRVVVDKVTYDFSGPHPGDVIVFKGPDSWGANTEFHSDRSANAFVRWLQDGASLLGLAPPDERDFIKRVIATGGQRVECCDSQDRVLVNGKPLDESSYIYWTPGTTPADQKRFGPIIVPKDHLWVMGDNRNNSADSRYHPGGLDNGSVPIPNVIGKARAIVLPPSRWQGINDRDPQPSALGAPIWQAAAPGAVGVAGAWPVLWIGRRLRGRATRRGGRR